jgi:hypothetical protein
VYAAQALLYPLPFALAGLAFAPGTWALSAAILVWLSKAFLDGATARTLRGTGFGPRVIWLSPLKDLLFLFAFVRAFGENSVQWRGNRFLVQAGSRLQRVCDPATEGVLALER